VKCGLQELARQGRTEQLPEIPASIALHRVETGWTVRIHKRPLERLRPIRANRFNPNNFKFLSGYCCRNVHGAPEIQRAPDLLLAIRKMVDEDYRPGRLSLA